MGKIIHVLYSFSEMTKPILLECSKTIQPKGDGHHGNFQLKVFTPKNLKSN